MPRCWGIVGAHDGFQRWECAGCAAEDCEAFPWNGGLSLKDLFIRNKAITDARFSENILRALGIDFEFLAKLAHLDTQIFGVIGILGSPDMRENTLMRQHTPMVGSQISKKFVLGTSEFDFFITAFDNVPGEIDCK